MKALKITCAIMLLVSSLSMVACKKQCQGPDAHKKKQDCSHHDVETATSKETDSAGT
jgi:hypothetical protein